MEWRGGRQSTHVDDRRMRRIPGGGRGLGVIGILMALVVAWMTGDPRALIGALTGGSPAVASDTSPPSAAEEEVADFMRTVLASTEDVWKTELLKYGATYREPTLVLFREAVESACGMQGAAVGPFYCPNDEQLYLDLSFFEELERKLGAPGDFAQAYVIAHEVGHHLQHILGTDREVRAAQERGGEASANELSVRLELQADFYAGVWAHFADRSGTKIERGDVEEALNAAAQIGDDNLQRRGQGRIVPESFTHGTSAQRVRWFKRGLESGDLRQGDTFAAGSL
ncbi:MAG TPA: neutral zinc metallopeptidase [Planctomycetota bacterium]|nr:neutral zinc metallopeptidase [Planctomycetota bacterium]